MLLHVQQSQCLGTHSAEVLNTRRRRIVTGTKVLFPRKVPAAGALVLDGSDGAELSPVLVGRHVQIICGGHVRVVGVHVYRVGTRRETLEVGQLLFGPVDQVVHAQEVRLALSIQSRGAGVRRAGRRASPLVRKVTYRAEEELPQNDEMQRICTSTIENISTCAASNSDRSCGCN